MAKEKSRQYDGRSRPTNKVYSKRWEEIFGKKEKTKKEKTKKKKTNEEDWSGIV